MQSVGARAEKTIYLQIFWFPVPSRPLPCWASTPTLQLLPPLLLSFLKLGELSTGPQAYKPSTWEVQREDGCEFQAGLESDSEIRSTTTRKPGGEEEKLLGKLWTYLLTS